MKNLINLTSLVRRFPVLKTIPYLKSIYLLILAFKKLPLLGVYDYFLATLIPRKSIISIRLQKNRAIRLRNNDTDVLIFKQIFLLDDVKLPISFNPKTIIDGGAHIGCSSIYYAIAYPDAKIIAVEAEESNYK